MTMNKNVCITLQCPFESETVSYDSYECPIVTIYPYSLTNTCPRAISSSTLNNGKTL